MTVIEFYNKLYSMAGKLERFAFSLVTNRQDAMDLIQETYLKALSNRSKYREFDNFKAWVFTIMKNTFINMYRRSVRENIRFDNSADLYYLNGSVSSSAPTPESDYLAVEIATTIEGMADEFRIPFQMHNAGYKYKEIAVKLGLKIGTVKSRIYFCRRKLMEALES